MIDLYTWTTPNGRKVSILLEELNINYKVIPINITKNEQFSEEFINISPNNKIPAIFDHEQKISLMESGAILLYLAEKYKNPQEKYKAAPKKYTALGKVYRHDFGTVGGGQNPRI